MDGTFALTHIGTAAMLLEIGEFRIVTDPVFDPPGRRYAFAFGASSKKTEEPAALPSELGPVDAVLLSHDHHADNLDDAGRAFLPRAKHVLTTAPGARRLGGNARGLVEWESFELVRDGGAHLRVTAVPARHGPPLSLPFVGKTIGFVLEWEGRNNGALYISGDTVFFSGITEIAERFRIGTAILHLGSVKFRISGPLRYTFDAKDAVRAIRALAPTLVVPIHYAGWSHFTEPRAHALSTFEAAGLADTVRWVTPGERVTLS